MTHVLDGECVVETGDHTMKEARCGRGEDHVVDVQMEVGGGAVVVVDEQGRVCLGRDEAERRDVPDEAFEPRP